MRIERIEDVKLIHETLTRASASPTSDERTAATTQAVVLLRALAADAATQACVVAAKLATAHAEEVATASPGRLVDIADLWMWFAKREQRAPHGA